MSETRSEPTTKQVHIRPGTYKALRRIAAECDGRLMEVTEEVIAAGLPLIQARLAEAIPSSN